jgi:soluble lytic murein transglycosylase-like protein
MKALQATCIVGAITFTGMIHLVGGNTPGATVSDAMPEAAVSAETPGAPALPAAVPEASAAGSGPSLMAQAEIGDDSFEAKWVALGHHDAAQPMPTTHDAPNDAPKPAPVTQDFRYFIYYVWSELPPAEKPAAIVLSSLKDTPVGTPVEEIKRASDAFGLDFNFMKAVAKIESGFDPKQRTGSYISACSN